MSIMALDEDFFFLITAAVAEWHDFEWLQKHLPQDTEITLENVTEQLHLPDPLRARSRATSSPRSADADLVAALAVAPVAARSPDAGCSWCASPSPASSAGKSTPRSRTPPAIFDAVWAAGQKHGLKPFGMFALDSLRLEKGYRAWKGDLSTDYTVLQGGLERFVKWDKPDFSGKAALQNEKQQGVTKRFVTLVVEAGECDAPYMSTLWHDGEIVGETTVRRLGPPGGQIDRARHAARRPGRAGHRGRGRDFRRALRGDRPDGRAAVGSRERKTESIDMPQPSSRISGIVPSGKDGWEVHFAAMDRKQAGEDIIMLSVGDHDFDTPAETVEACVTAVRGGHHHYTQLPGMPRAARGDGERLDALHRRRRPARPR